MTICAVELLGCVAAREQGAKRALFAYFNVGG